VRERGGGGEEGMINLDSGFFFRSRVVIEGYRPVIVTEIIVEFTQNVLFKLCNLLCKVVTLAQGFLSFCLFHVTRIFCYILSLGRSFKFLRWQRLNGICMNN